MNRLTNNSMNSLHYINLHYFFIFPSSLTFHNISSMQAVASSAVSWPQTVRNIYTVYFKTWKMKCIVGNPCSQGLYIMNFGTQFFIWIYIVLCVWWNENLMDSQNNCTLALDIHDDPPLSWMILLRYSAVRVLRVSLWGVPRWWGKTTDVSTTVPWNNYSKEGDIWSYYWA